MIDEKKKVDQAEGSLCDYECSKSPVVDKMSVKKKVLLIFTCVIAGLAIACNLFFDFSVIDLIVQIKNPTDDPLFGLGVGIGMALVLALWIVSLLALGIPTLILTIIAMVKKLKRVGLSLLIAYLVSVLITLVLWIVCINTNNSQAALAISSLSSLIF